LVDAVVISGSSGSPVFDCRGNFLGILFSHINYYHSDAALPEIVGSGIKVDGYLRVNSGLGRMVPVDKVISFLASFSNAWGEEETVTPPDTTGRQ